MYTWMSVLLIGAAYMYVYTIYQHCIRCSDPYNTVLIITSYTHMYSADRQFRRTCMQYLYVVQTHIDMVLIRSDTRVYNAGK